METTVVKWGVYRASIGRTETLKPCFRNLGIELDGILALRSSWWFQPGRGSSSDRFRSRLRL